MAENGVCRRSQFVTQIEACREIVLPLVWSGRWSFGRGGHGLIKGKSGESINMVWILLHSLIQSETTAGAHRCYGSEGTG